MPAPGTTPPANAPKVTLASFIMGEEMVPRAEAAVDYGKLPALARWGQDLFIKLIQKYGVRTALKWTSKLLALVGGSALTVEAHQVEGFVSVLIALVIGGVEQLASYWARKRYERKVADAKPAKATVVQ